MKHTNLNVESKSSQNTSDAAGRGQLMAREAQPMGDSDDDDARRLRKMAASAQNRLDLERMRFALHKEQITLSKGLTRK